MMIQASVKRDRHPQSGWEFIAEFRGKTSMVEENVEVFRNEGYITIQETSYPH